MNVQQNKCNKKKNESNDDWRDIRINNRNTK